MAKICNVNGEPWQVLSLRCQCGGGAGRHKNAPAAVSSKGCHRDTERASPEHEGGVFACNHLLLTLKTIMTSTPTVSA